MKQNWTLALFAFGLFGAACVDPADINCNDALTPSFIVVTVDSITGAVVADPVVWVRDGEFTDTLHTDRGHSSSAWERPGTYTVRAEHPAYAPWVRDGVQIVQVTRCDASQVQLTALMQPLE